jgi:hypothetical protein
VGLARMSGEASWVLDGFIFAARREKRDGEVGVWYGTGCMGHAWKTWAGRGEGKWAGPEEIVKVLIYLNIFPTSSNYFDQKVDLPSFKIYK